MVYSKYTRRGSKVGGYHAATHKRFAANRKKGYFLPGLKGRMATKIQKMVKSAMDRLFTTRIKSMMRAKGANVAYANRHGKRKRYTT
jgi:hypothetical protein